MSDKTVSEPPSDAGFKIGYARVSTEDQRLDLQLDDLKKAGCKTIYQEKASGGKSDRPELANCIKSLRPGDTLVVWKLDRLGRSMTDLLNIVNSLPERGVAFESLTENLDTSSATGKLLFHIFGAMADFERSLAKERTVAGLKAARKRGRVGGRPRKLDPMRVQEARLLVDNGIPMSRVAKTFGVSRTTLWNWLRRN